MALAAPGTRRPLSALLKADISPSSNGLPTMVVHGTSAHARRPLVAVSWRLSSGSAPTAVRGMRGRAPAPLAAATEGFSGGHATMDAPGPNPSALGRAGMVVWSPLCTRMPTMHPNKHCTAVPLFFLLCCFVEGPIFGALHGSVVCPFFLFLSRSAYRAVQVYRWRGSPRWRSTKDAGASQTFVDFFCVWL